MFYLPVEKVFSNKGILYFLKDDRTCESVCIELNMNLFAFKTQKCTWAKGFSLRDKKIYSVEGSKHFQRISLK